MIINNILTKISTQVKCKNNLYPIIFAFSLMSILQIIIISFSMQINFLKIIIITICTFMVLINIKKWFSIINRNFIEEKIFIEIKIIEKKNVDKSYNTSFFLFLVSEFMIFFALFWSWLHFSLATSVNIIIWPSKGIEIMNFYGLSFYNTIILVSSSLILNWVEICIKNKKNFYEVFLGITCTIYMGILFILAQYIKFSRLPFNIKDSVYSNIFYTITGLHLTHVAIGLVMLMIFLIKFFFQKIR